MRKGYSQHSKAFFNIHKPKSHTERAAKSSNFDEKKIHKIVKSYLASHQDTNDNASQANIKEFHDLKIDASNDDSQSSDSQSEK